jgi:hypothetical protein
MLHLYKVVYEKINDKELPEELFNSYDDKMVFYVLAESNSDASDLAWFSLPLELENYFEETSNTDIQSPHIEADFIDNYQNELKMAKDNILKANGYLNSKTKEYFDAYLKTE